MQQRKYSMPHPILTKFTLWLSSRNYATFLIVTKSIQSNSGSVLADSTGDFTKQSIGIQSPSIPHPSILAKYLGIIVRKPIATISSITGKWSSKPQMEKENISLICWMTILLLSNPLTWKEVYGFYHLVTRTHCACMPLELLQIILRLVNTGLGSSPMKNLSAHVVIILSNQEDIFFTIVWDLMGTRTQEETLLVILSCSWQLIQTLLCS